MASLENIIMSSLFQDLPVSHIIRELQNTLEIKKCAVLQAPPGAGKTTGVPLALKDETWLAGLKIIMLEPRRLAARASAARMAEMLSEPLKKTVGYHIRMERCSGSDTKIEVVTEGIFIRMIQRDPALTGVGLVIFDEFHERNLNSDLGLALALETQEALREDLRILVMSATLDVTPISELMNHAPVIISEGKTYSVDTRYKPYSPGINRINRLDIRAIEMDCLFYIRKALSEEKGDILVFLPGVGEIRRLEKKLKESDLGKSVTLHPLYGNLTKKEQDSAIRPSVSGMRKIVLATSIAETSLTIEGITIVVDSGLMRVPRFYSGTGMSRLETLPLSQSSADQRRGRAGRTRPGICYRMWSETGHVLLKSFNPPEIMNVDLAFFVLELALWGVSNPGDLKWLDHPPESAVRQARNLLKELGALDEEGRATKHGKELASMGIHPRLGHMILHGKMKGTGSLACRIAALLSERDFIGFASYEKNSDIRLRLEILDLVMRGKKVDMKGITLKQGVLTTIIKSIRKFERDLNLKQQVVPSDYAGLLIAAAYPDRIAKSRKDRVGTFLMTSGSGAFLPETDPLAFESFITIAAQSGDRKQSRIYLAAPLSLNDIQKDFQHLIETKQTVVWNKKKKGVEAREVTCLHRLILEERKLNKPDPERVRDAMMIGIKSLGLSHFSWNKTLKNWQSRVIFLKKTGFEKELPDLTDTALLETLDVWLKPWLIGVSTSAQLKKLNLKEIFLSMLTWKQQQFIETQAPTHILVPSGSKLPLSYDLSSDNSDISPVLAVRLQEMFGLLKTPHIAGGRVPVTLHLLSPAGRPVQVTRDLESFWNNTYLDVKKDLKGRYPKHYWPDNPITAQATNRVLPK